MTPLLQRTCSYPGSQQLQATKLSRFHLPSSPSTHLQEFSPLRISLSQMARLQIYSQPQLHLLTYSLQMEISEDLSLIPRLQPPPPLRTSPFQVSQTFQ